GVRLLECQAPRPWDGGVRTGVFSASPLKGEKPLATILTLFPETGGSLPRTTRGSGWPGWLPGRKEPRAFLPGRPNPTPDRASGRPTPGPAFGLQPSPRRRNFPDSLVPPKPYSTCPSPWSTTPWVVPSPARVAPGPPPPSGSTRAWRRLKTGPC